MSSLDWRTTIPVPVFVAPSFWSWLETRAYYRFAISVGLCPNHRRAQLRKIVAAMPACRMFRGNPAKTLPAPKRICLHLMPGLPRLYLLICSFAQINLYLLRFSRNCLKTPSTLHGLGQEGTWINWPLFLWVGKTGLPRSASWRSCIPRKQLVSLATGV